MADLIAYSKKGVVNQTGGEFPSRTVAAVFATITVHDTRTVMGTQRDSVVYSDGPLDLTTSGGKEALAGLLPARVNETKHIATPAPPSGISTGKDILFDESSLKVGLSLDKDGNITIYRMIGNAYYLGRPPETYAGRCTKEVVSNLFEFKYYGLLSVTITFNKGTRTLRP
jgi:hypothetical protein